MARKGKSAEEIIGALREAEVRIGQGETVGLMRAAASLLPSGGLHYLYGPYQRNGEHTAPSNAAFDADLRSRSPEWGVRDLEAVVRLAVEHGFSGIEIETMPANNLSVFFSKV